MEGGAPQDGQVASSDDPTWQRQGEPRRVRGVRLYFQQTRALSVKNVILAWRSKLSTILRLGSSFFFIFLIYCVDRSVRTSNGQDTSYKDLMTPAQKPVAAIPECETGLFMKTPCYDFLWSGNGSAAIVQLAQNISLNNPGRPIDFSTRTLGFATPSDVDDWLLANPYRTGGALHFFLTPTGGFEYGVQTNSTPRAIRGDFEDVTFKFAAPLQVAAEREIARHLAQDPALAWAVGVAEFAHPSIQTFSAVADAGPTFLLAAAMFGFVILVSNLVLERELRLRQAMATMGLTDGAFWSSWAVWEALLAAVWALLLVLFGMAFDFDFFQTNDFGVLYVTFLLFSLSLIGFAFLVSAFISKATSATTVGFIVFIVGFITQLVVVFGFPYDGDKQKGFQVLWSLFPPNLLAIALKYLGDATLTSKDPGVSWGGVDECSYRNSDCSLTMAGIWRWMVALFVVYGLLGIYLDNVLPDANGVRKPLYYFLLPSYWLRGSHKKQQGGGCCSCGGRLPQMDASSLVGTAEEDDDVAAEEALVKEQAESGMLPSDVAVSVQGLAKTYPGSRKCVGCCRLKRTDAFHALRGLWLNVERGKLLCLLGPNGAGKSTTINLLTGILPATAGDALIYGDSIRSSSAMSDIRSRMGVCPQFDILWDALTGREHLRLFAAIKGLHPSIIAHEVGDLLARVRLAEAGGVRAAAYSGGMRRRLSLATALIGDPSILFLDEPTTGMDPVTRRHVWDIVEGAKRARAVVLTTHSMEEADVLGDRISILARGRLRCVGTSIRLKSKFGAGYIVNVSVAAGRGGGGERGVDAAAEESVAAVRAFFRQHLGVEAVEELGTYMKFLIPREKEPHLAGFFALLKERRAALGVGNLQLSLTTLEDVFLSIATRAEREAALTEGRCEALALPDGPVLSVPIGEPTAQIPGSISPEMPHGAMVEVYWQQDDEGRLRISGHSDIRPVSPSLHPEPLQNPVYNVQAPPHGYGMSARNNSR
eukprot:jgi/Mesen1/10586/ME000085S09913